MENASRALLIAGAVLIVILLIGIGMLIYSRSTGVTDTASNTMKTQEILAFNSQFTPYEGTNQPSSSVNALIQAVITNNGTNNKNVTITLIYDTYNTGGKTPTEISTNVIPFLNNDNKFDVEMNYDQTSGLIYNIFIKKI